MEELRKQPGNSPRRWLAEGDDVSVITMHPGNEESTETLNGVRIYRIPMDNLYWPFGCEVEAVPTGKRLLWHIRDMWNPAKTAARVGRILDIEKPEVVNSHLIIGFSPAVWREVKKRGIRLVHTMHDYYLMCPRADMFGKGKTCETRCLQCKALTATRKISSASVDSVVSVSKYVLDAHKSRDYFPDVPGSVIYNVSTPPGNAAARHRQSRRRPSCLWLPRTARSFQRSKNSLLEATRLLTSDNWRLRIGGTGLEATVQALKSEFTDPRIEWLGFTNSDNYFRSIHVSIVPSLWADPLPLCGHRIPPAWQGDHSQRLGGNP